MVVSEVVRVSRNSIFKVLRKLFQCFCALTIVFVSGAAAQSPRMQQLRGHVPAAAARITPVGKLADSTTVDLIIGLPLRNQASLDSLLKDLYDPASPRFHQYLSPGQYTQMFAPTQATFQRVVAFAKTKGLKVVSTAPNRRSLHVRAPASTVNRVFHVTLQQYKHPTENRQFFAPDIEPSLALDVPVSYVTGLDNFRLPGRFLNPQVRARKGPSDIKFAGGSGSGGSYTGKDFRAAYAPGVSLTGKGQVVGILELAGYAKSDIQTYEMANGFPDVPLQNVYLDGYTGGNPNSESAADIELVISMAPGISKAIIYGAPYNGPGVHDILTEMANPTHGEPLPYQITTSYYFFYDPNVYAALQQFAVQGQTLFVASGDWGSYDEGIGSGAFPPADHPLVTSVGSTDLQTNGPGGPWMSETTSRFSGGGYSPWGADPQFAIPSWQAGMDFTLSQGSNTTRNAPDVAIVGNNISVYFNGQWTWFAGTSASSPLWAGFLALANEQAAASARPRIGFANPALYAIGRGGTCPSCFHDIATGNNFNVINPSKYSAVTGYDLCTGWGTPNGKTLIDALVNYGVGWGRLPGGGTTNVSDAATTFQDRIHIFGIGINDHRHYMNVFDGQNWTGWSLIPGGGTTFLSDAATVFQNRLYLFAIGINDHKHYVNSFDGQNWSGWSAVPGGGTTTLPDTATVFQNRLYLFAIGTNDHKHYMNSFDGQNWTGWSLIPGGGTTFLSDAATVFQNRLYLFAIGINDHKHYVNSFDGQNWSGWSAVPGGGTTTLADAAAVLGNKLYLFAIGINDHKHYANSFDGQSWGGWGLVPSGGTTALSDAVTTFRDRLYLFAVGINDHQHYMTIFP